MASDLKIGFDRELNEDERRRLQTALQAAIGSHLVGHTAAFSWADDEERQ